MMTGIKVTVEEQLCAASAMCKRIAPSIFDLPDDADWAVVLTPVVSGDEQVKLAREAFDACPTQAIVLEEAG
jgi:ferredoxin